MIAQVEQAESKVWAYSSYQVRRVRQRIKDQSGDLLNVLETADLYIRTSNSAKMLLSTSRTPCSPAFLNPHSQTQPIKTALAPRASGLETPSAPDARMELNLPDMPWLNPPYLADSSAGSYLDMILNIVGFVPKLTGSLGKFGDNFTADGDSDVRWPEPDPCQSGKPLTRGVSSSSTPST